MLFRCKDRYKLEVHYVILDKHNNDTDMDNNNDVIKFVVVSESLEMKKIISCSKVISLAVRGGGIAGFYRQLSNCLAWRVESGEWMLI